MQGATLDRQSNPNSVRGYAFYDWGKSAFETSVTTAVLPAWFAYLFLKANGLEAEILGRNMTSDAVWSVAVAIGALLVAIASPSLGVIADRRAIKMWWLRILTYLGAGSTIALAFAPMLDISFQWVWIFVMFLLANIGLNGAGVFYNALLPHMGTDDEMDAISNKAFAYGYFGGGVLLLIHLIMITFIVDGAGSNPSWLIPFVMASSGAWWLGFAMLTFKYVPEPEIENEMESLGINQSAKLAFSELKKTFSEWRKFKTLFIYMFAYFLFIDGINSVTALAGIYGITVLGLTTTALIATILVIQFVAAPCAIGFTRLAEATSTKSALTMSLIGWVVVVTAALSFAPLELSQHSEYDFQYDWNEETSEYDITVGETAFALKLSVDESEQDWATKWLNVMPVHEDDNYDDRTIYEFNNPDTESDEYRAASIADTQLIEIFFADFSETRFSASVSGGSLDGHTALGDEHPTSLGDGPLDFVPEAVRDKLWEPLGFSVMYQFLLLGCMAGALLGGSQGLARSLFGQMVPETRSAEFFGFFGFFGKVAALLGPAIYAYMTIMYDSRVGVASLCLLIIAGTFLMRMVDVDSGREDARAEDSRNRGIEESS
ncbi:MAG: MFS transporter [Candidatus Thalassarchaeaceae archaeon]